MQKQSYLLSILICLLLLLFCNKHLCAQSDDSSKNKSHLLAVPIISRSIETDWSFGAGGTYTFYTTRKKDSTTRTSSIRFLGSYSLRKQFIFTINGPVFFPGEKYILNSHFSYSSFPDRFWGVGNQTVNTNEEEYDFRQFYVHLHGERLLGHKVFAGLIYDFQRVIDINVKNGGLFDQQNVAGRQPYQVSGLGGSISWDTRNNTFWPNKGHLISLQATHFTSLLLSDHRYTNFLLDARLYKRIIRKQILAVQAYGFLNTGADVPVRSLASLGGADRMRGYFNGRYRDDHLLSLQAEYRVPVYKRFSAVGFAGVGDVAGRFSTLALSQLKYSYGGGLRFAVNKQEKLHIRFDYGFGKGKGNQGFYLQFGEAF
jgi:outer membrane protein assembly factor BamA